MDESALDAKAGLILSYTPPVEFLYLGKRGGSHASFYLRVELKSKLPILLLFHTEQTNFCMRV